MRILLHVSANSLAITESGNKRIINNNVFGFILDYTESLAICSKKKKSFYIYKKNVLSYYMPTMLNS